MKRSLLILFCLFSLGSFAQERAFKFYVPFHIDAGVGLAKMKRESGFDVIQIPSVALELMGGGSVVYKNRVGLNLEGGVFINTYAFEFEQSSFDLAIWNPRTVGTLFVNTNELNKHGSRLHFGIGYGFSFYSGAKSTKTSADVRSDVLETRGTASLLTPEIGLSQYQDKGKMDLLLSYTYQLDADPNVVTTFTSPEGKISTASTTLNKLSLRVRYAFWLQPRIAQKQPTPPTPIVRNEVSKEFSERRTDTALDVKTRRKTVKLSLRDNADEDGDVVSVSLNGVYVLQNYELKNKKKTLKIKVKEGVNSIVVYAHNEGRVPPNTATCTFKAGLFKEKVVLTTSLKRNQEIRVLRE